MVRDNNNDYASEKEEEGTNRKPEEGKNSAKKENKTEEAEETNSGKTDGSTVHEKEDAPPGPPAAPAAQSTYAGGREERKEKKDPDASTNNTQEVSVASEAAGAKGVARSESGDDFDERLERKMGGESNVASAAEAAEKPGFAHGGNGSERHPGQSALPRTTTDEEDLSGAKSLHLTTPDDLSDGNAAVVVDGGGAEYDDNDDDGGSSLEEVHHHVLHDAAVGGGAYHIGEEEFADTLAAISSSSSRVGAFRVSLPAMARSPLRTSEASSAHEEGREHLRSLENGDDDGNDAVHAVHDAHVVAPAARSSATWHDQVRDRLVRDAPLVDATIVHDSNLHGGDDEEEGREREGGGAGRSESTDRARTSQRSTADRSSNELLGNNEQPRRTGTGRKGHLALCGLTRVRALLVCAAAAALVLGVSIPLSRRSGGNDDDEVVNNDIPSGPPPWTNDNATETAAPSWSPTLSDTVSLAPTSEPTSWTATVSDRFLSLKEVVHAVSDESDLTDPTSPQHRALSWLADDDDYAARMMNMSALSATTLLPTVEDLEVTMEDTERWIQRYIAAVFLFSTDEDWPDAEPLEDILNRGDECTWNDFKPQFPWETPKGVLCSEQDGRIVSMNFGGLWRPIAGTLPPEIGYLPNLQHLIITQNPKIVGSIPDSILRLQNLRRVHFGLLGEGFSGTIPSFNAPDMREILIGVSRFNGTIPSSFGNMSKLVMLTITDCDLTGTLPEYVADLKELVMLGMGKNRLTGSIPASLGQNQNDLVLVGLGSNMMNGTIPGGLLERENLLGLFLNGNRFTGSIGSEFGRMARLKRLVLHSNALSSTIPPELGNGTSLEALELGDNRLNGTVPASLGNLLNLKSISLKGNSDLHGGLDFLCNKTISNLLLDCAVSNPNLDCGCCECCHGSTHTCGQYPDGTSFRVLYFSECCMKQQCGANDCTGVYPYPEHLP